MRAAAERVAPGRRAFFPTQELHKQVADFAAQRLAISEVLRAIASSPDDLQPILRSILDNAVHLCRAEEWGASSVWPRKEAFVASNLKPAVLAQYTLPILLEHGSFIARVIASKSPVHIPDWVAHEVYRAGEAHLMALVKAGLTTALCMPMLRNDKLIGSMAIGRGRMEPFTEKEIELVTDFAAGGCHCSEDYPSRAANFANCRCSWRTRTVS